MVHTKIFYKKEYDGESIIDLPEDMGNMFDPYWNKYATDIPQDEYGLHQGKFVVTVEWVDTEDNESDKD